MKRILFFLLLLLPFFAKGQIITTFAGTGSSIFSGDGGPATAAGINAPCWGGVFDKYGNYYFCDAIDDRVRKIDAAGIITTIAGNGIGGFSGDNGPATSAELNRPSGVKLDTSGNIYIVDNINNRIRKIDIITGVIVTIAGTGVGAFSGDGGPATAADLSNPQDIAVDQFGNIYISDMFNYRIRKVDRFGIISTYAGGATPGFAGDGGPATAAVLSYPTGLDVDDAGNLYIADPGSFSNRVRKINTSGIITSVAGSSTATYIGDGIPATNAAISPKTVTVDRFNNLYIADHYNKRVYKVDGAGFLHTIAGNGTDGDGGDGGPATAAQLYWPNGAAVDSCGNVYIPTAGKLTVPGTGRRIRKISFNPNCWALGVESHHNTQNISIYPNPVHDEFIISSSDKITSVVISNLFGQVMYSQMHNEEQVKISVAPLVRGIYFVKINGVDIRRFEKD